MSANKEAKGSVESMSDFDQDVAPVFRSEWNFRSVLAILSSALAYFVTVGFANAYGVFQQYYSAHILVHKSQFQISWIGSMSTFVLFAAAVPAGRLADRYGHTMVITFGAVCEVIAVFMVSLCKEYYQFFLAQGILLAIGMSFVAIPSSGIIPAHFSRHRGFAQGLSIGGSSLGGIIWPIVFDQLLNHDSVSFGWAMRTAGFIMIPLLAIVVLCLRKPAPTATSNEDTPAAETSGGGAPEAKVITPAEGHAKDLSSLRQPAFILLCLGLAMAYFGFFTPIYFTTTYAVSIGISETYAFYLVSILNAASFFGRVLPGLLADRVGQFNVICVATVTSSVICFCWTTATSSAGLTVWALAYGFASGAILSLQLVCATTFSTAKTHGATVGIAMASVSLTGLFGTPIAGELADRGYLALSSWGGATLLAGAALMMAARISRNHRLLAKV